MRVIIEVEASSSKPFVGLFFRLQGLLAQRSEQGAVSVQGPLDLPCGSFPRQG